MDPDEILDPEDPRLEDGRTLGPQQLAERAVESVLGLTRRANALAGGVLMFVTFAVVVGFALGLAALSGGIRTVWIVVGGFFALVGIGSVVRSMWRLRQVRATADGLVGEVRSLISGDRRNQQVVVETVERTDEGVDVSVVQLSRDFSGMQSMVGGSPQSVPRVASAVRAVTTFPLFMALATLIGVVFLFLGLLFLIALAI